LELLTDEEKIFTVEKAKSLSENSLYRMNFKAADVQKFSSLMGKSFARGTNKNKK
jgi:hypothetical protein